MRLRVQVWVPGLTSFYSDAERRLMAVATTQACPACQACLLWRGHVCAGACLMHSLWSCPGLSAGFTENRHTFSGLSGTGLPFRSVRIRNSVGVQVL